MLEDGSRPLCEPCPMCLSRRANGYPRDYPEFSGCQDGERIRPYVREKVEAAMIQAGLAPPQFWVHGIVAREGPDAAAIAGAFLKSARQAVEAQLERKEEASRG